MGNSTKVGSLVVDVDGDISKLRTEMRAAVGVLQTAATDMQARSEAMRNGLESVLNPIKSITDKLGPLAAGFGTILSLNAFGEMVKGATDAAEKLHDLASQTGVTVEALSALEEIGKYTDTSLDTIASTMNKLSKNSAVMTEEGKGAGAALRALGIDFDSFRNMSPDEQMMTVAKAMDNFSDGGGKSAAAMALMGKEGAALIPFMKDLAAAGELQATVTTEQAAMADNFNDNMTRIQVTGEAWKKQLSMSLLPVMSELSEAWIVATSGSDGLGGSIKRNAADGTFAEWARTAVTGVTYLIDAGQGLLSLLPIIGKGIAGMAAMGSAAFGAIYDAYLKIKEGDLSGAWDELKSGANEVKTVAVATGEDISNIWNQDLLGEKIRKGMAEVRSAKKELATEDKKLKLNASDFDTAEDDKKRAKATKERAAAYSTLIKTINEKNEALVLEVQAEENLTDGQKVAVRVMSDVRDGTLKLTDAEKVQLGLTLERYLAQEQLTLSHKRMLALGAGMVKAGEDQVKTLDAQIEAAQKSNDEMGLTKEQVEQLSIKKLGLAAASDEELASNMRLASEYAGDLKDAYLTYADSLDQAAKKKRDLMQIKADGIEKQRAIDETNRGLKEQIDIWNSVENTVHETYKSITDGSKDVATRMRESLKNGFFDWLYQMTIKKWFINVGAGLTATASGSAMASTGMGSGSMLDPSNLLSAGKSLWDGFTAAGTLGNGFWGSVAGGLQGAGAGSGLTSAVGLDIGNYLQGMLGNNVAGSLSSGISSISAAMPYAAAAIAAFQISKSVNGGYRLGGLSADAGALLGFAPRLFGMKEKEMGGQTVTGTLGTNNLMRNQSWTQDGGVFRSDRSGVWSYGLKDSVATTSDGKSYVDSKSLDSDKELLKILNGGYDAVKTASTEFAKILGLNADQIATRNDALNLTLGKTQEENDKAIAAVFGGIADAIALDLIPNIAALKKEGESSAGTLARLAGGLLGVNNVIAAMGFDKMSSDMGGAKSAQYLLDATGGIEKFSAGAAYFTENFLSEAEKMKPSIDAVASTLGSLGMSNLKSVEDFKLAVVGGKDANGNLVKGLDLTTEAGAKTFAQLMAISPQFKAVADYTDSLGGSLSVVEAELKKTNESWQQQIDALEKAKLSQEQLRESELMGVADSTKLLIEKAHALQDEATASVKAKAAADKLAATNESLEARIDALVNASLSLDQQRQAELTGVADSTKLLIERAHALEDEATASAEAKAAADKLAATNESLEARIDALVKASLSLDEQRQSELTGVADSTKLLIQRVHGLEDEATASAKAKAAADKLAATNESLEARIDALVKAGLSLDEQRQSELTGVADSTKLLIQRVHVLEDEATASAKAKAAADKLAATNESLEARIDALVKASLSLDEQRQSELTGVADSTKLLIQRVHALEDEATASAKAKAAIEKLKATNDSIQQQIDAMVRASLPLEEQRRLEIVGVDGTTEALKKQLWALEDSERALLDKAAKEKQVADDRMKAEQEAESAFNNWLGDVKSAFDAESGVFKDIIDQFTQIGNSLKEYRNSLDTGDHALLTADEQYQANKTAWENLLVAIDNKEEGALEKYQAVTDAFLDSSKERNASSADYFKDLDAAKKAADKSVIAAYEHVDVAKQQLNYLEQQVKGLFDINESVKSLASLMGGSGSTAQALNGSGMSAREVLSTESNVSQNLANVGGFDALYNKTLAGDQDAMRTLQEQMVRWSGFGLKSEQYDRLVGQDSLKKMLDLFNLRIEDFRASSLTTWNGKETKLNFDRNGLFAGTTSHAKIADELKAMQAAYVAPAAYNKRADIIETRLPPQFASTTQAVAAPVAVGGDEESKKLLRRNNELMVQLINANVTGSNGVVGSVKNLTQKFSSINKLAVLEKAKG